MSEGQHFADNIVDYIDKHCYFMDETEMKKASQDSKGCLLTIDQFMQLGVRCCMCEDLAVWISKVKGVPRMPAYCDRHYPYHATKEEEHDKTRTE